MGGDISIGAVGAALIAGVVSLLGLIISKEQKTSEFRQAWVDALRSEITAYLTSFNAIADALGVTYKDHAEKVKALAPLYSQLNQASFAITLRVNPDESRSKAVLACMKRFQQLTANDSNMVPANIRPIELDFLNASKELLKYEWKRVKRGELTFIITKVLAALVVIAALWYWLFAEHKDEFEKDKLDGKAAIISNVINDFNQPNQPLIAPPHSKLPIVRPLCDEHVRWNTSDHVRLAGPKYPARPQRKTNAPAQPATSGVKPNSEAVCPRDNVSPQTRENGVVQND
ncbi:hypothetical protein [Sphingomonas bisphenolicum]|uniref:Fungal N-terminal domain-containing protein n=1 Tax=Sphingomonas bisphenolicum TaxID=296544 RepID=A0ABN5W770_9SPHN|nr:hypothetical protein [Sphingomonas bisphenolicum]BBF67885.1 hypothetical protein SBA_ch1_00850 [Sphingomonas bisphenolicum]